jgi:hypothetical protein
MAAIFKQTCAKELNITTDSIEKKMTMNAIYAFSLINMRGLASGTLRPEGGRFFEFGFRKRSQVKTLKIS